MSSASTRGDQTAPGIAAPGTVAVQPARSLGQRALLFGFRGSAVGIGVSLLIHSILLLISALLLFQVAQIGNSTESGRDVQIAMLAGSELEQLHGAALDVTTPRIGDNTPLPDVPAGPPLNGPSDSDSPGSGGDLGGIVDAMRGTGAGLDGEGAGLGSGGSGGGAASFFGVEAKGSRFAYISDISGSMRGEKLESLKIELQESIGGMMEHMSFFVCFFSAEAYPMGARTKWTAASDEGKRWAAAQIMKVDAMGGTVPDPAFELVFAMKPRPEAIYLMTDGLFDPTVAEKIAWLNRGGKKVPVHCLAFMDRSSEATMKEIAERSGGTYTFIEGPRRKR